MVPKGLKRLNRRELLEMLLDLSKENDSLRKENLALRQKLESKTIAIDQCGSLAEAALQLNGIFEAAQAACEQYTYNIHARNEELEEHIRQMEQQTREKCEAMLLQARSEAQRCLEEARQTRKEENNAFAWLSEIMDDGE